MKFMKIRKYFKGTYPELKEPKGIKTFKMLVTEHDSKRQRIRYKTKVHTKNKTYI